MTRGVAEGGLTNADLIERLKLTQEECKKLKKIDLVRLAHEKQLFRDENEFLMTLPTKETTLKCYLHSVVHEGLSKVREKLETYVQMYSKLYVRGSIIANQIAIDVFGPIEVLETVPKYTFNQSQTSVELFTIITKKNSEMKHSFLPERWPRETKNTGERKLSTLLHHVDNVLQNQNLSNTLTKLLPDWRSLMLTSGWDNAINRMWSKYAANLQNHVLVHLFRLTKLYFDKVKLNKESLRDEIKEIFLKGLTKPNEEYTSHQDDIDHALDIRTFLDCPYYNTKFEYLSKYFDFCMFMRKFGIGEGTYFPISTMGRKYAYVDFQVAKYLLKQQQHQTFASMFNLTPKAFKDRRRELRKKCRKNKSKNIKNKWRQKGLSCMPRNARICSFETDGVGLSICLKTPISLYPLKPKPQDYNIGVVDNPVFIGGDEGRAKIMTCAISTCGYKKPETLTFCRRQYYKSIKHKQRVEWERSRTNNGDVKSAIEALSSTPKYSMFQDYVQQVGNQANVLEKEYLDNIDRGKYRMLLYRLKKRSLDLAAQKIIDKANGRPIVFGIGNANFAPTGKGEKSVPTTGFTKAIIRAKYRYTNKVNIIGIDEFRTTMCCCACGNVTEAPMTTKGQRSRRLRFCECCKQQNGSGLRDRDVQGARNMLWCTMMMFHGSERPSYLKRPPKSTQGLTPIENTPVTL